MKMIKEKTGPFRERPYFENEEIESICLNELRANGLLPTSPQPIRIDRFIEKRFKVTPKYEDLPAGVLGYTSFCDNGVESIVVSRELGDSQEIVSQRRLNTTLAHEAGHGLLHASLFVMEANNLSLFSVDDKHDHNDLESSKVLCRENCFLSPSTPKKYDGRWWEFQANKAMGSLLLPQILITKCLEPYIETTGQMGIKQIIQSKRLVAEKEIANVFEVNPIVAKIRLDALFPNTTQISL